MNENVTEILLAHREEFKRFLKKRVRTDEIAEDILQNSFRKGIESPIDGLNTESVLAWFYKILRNSIIDLYRSTASDKKKTDDYFTNLILENPELSSKELRDEICRCLKGILKSLKPDQADLITQVDFEGVSLEEMAQRLHISLNSLNVRLHRARQEVKKNLELSCGACTKHGCLNCECE